MQLILQTANVTADAKNCSYPNKVTVTNASELQEAVKMDHVCAKYKNNYRSIDNFLKSNVVVMDLDNDHTDDPDEWITAEKLEELLPDISYAVAPSRNHMVAKNGKAARPKYHVYFEIEEMTDAAAYAALKAAIHNAYPFFDGNALDAARFIFGADSGEAVWHEGWTTIDEEVVVELPDEETASGSGPILEGNRNNAMSRFAGRVLKRYGNTEKAHDAFMEHAQKCDPPLSDEELAIIWASAIRFFNKKVVGQDGYVPPEEYNQDFDGVSLEPEDFSDIGEAKVLAREYEDELIYSDATSFLRYDGTCWRENKQDAVGAVEEFLEMQLVDARDELNRCIEVLVEAGLSEKVVKAGGKALEKLITPELEKAYGAYLAAKNYYAFVMKCRNFKNLVNVQNAVKPMIQIKVEDLDANENMLNTPDATYDLSNLGIDYQQLDSDASIKKWNAGQLQVGLIHPASAGHGLNLQSGGNILVWFGITWSLELYQQTVARLWRQGQTEGTVSVIHIVTDGTVDERILKALEAKDLTQSALIDAVKAEVGDGK